jgi:hypothetical protein
MLPEKVPGEPLYRRGGRLASIKFLAAKVKITGSFP